jgi:DNA-binding CsgD family transcriptional regulator/tetratricopeptide (TPR) repeat protein
MMSSRLIGRQTELSDLGAALADASSGRPCFVFVAGESGVGKSRLLDELAAQAARDGVRVLRGDCVALGDSELPYAPFAGVLRRLARTDDPALARLAPGLRSELARLAPELGDARDEPSGEASAIAQGRLFEALLALLEGVVADRPALLVIEDLHWADRSTRGFLAFLASSLINERLLVALTYRTEELHRAHPLRPLLAELERDSRSRRIELAPLGHDELREQLTDILGAAPAPELVERLFGRSQGNPLYAEELLAAGLDGRGPAPPTLREALLVRVERLARPTQAVLEILAVAQRADEELLAATSHLEPADLRDALREAIDSHIVIARDDGVYVFRHALLREVIHDGLLPGERSECHRAMAAALEDRLEGGDRRADMYFTASIASHYAAAGDQPAALRACIRAAHAAIHLYAFGEAAHQLERALELWSRVPDPEAHAGIDHAELLLNAAIANRNAAEGPRALHLVTKAVNELDAEADPRRTAYALQHLSRAHFALGHTDEAAEALERGLALLRNDDPSPERVALLTRRARQLMLQSYFDAAVAAADEAIDDAAAIAGDHDHERVQLLISGATNAKGTALMSLGFEDEGERTLREAIDLCGDDPDAIASAYTNLADSLHLAGRSEKALAIAEEGMERVEWAPVPCRWLALVVVEILADLGQITRARAVMRGNDGPTTGTLRVNVDLRKARLALADDDVDAALELLEDAAHVARPSGQPQFYGPRAVMEADARCRRGELDEASRVIAGVFDCLNGDPNRAIPVAAMGATVAAHAAQRARDLGREDDERAAVARARDMTDVAQRLARPQRPVDLAYAALAHAEAQRAGSPTAGADEHLAAAAAFESLGRIGEASSARLRAAEALIAAGDRDGARAPLRSALEISRATDQCYLEDEARSLAARGRVTWDVGDGDGDRDGDAPPALDDDPFGLTPRERQVLALVASGATNREIGASLYMAEKTASVHVSRILAKLDVRSRTEAAGVAHRLGLDAEPVIGPA